MNKYYLIMFFIASVKLNAQSFVNGSFENWGDPSICETNLTPDSWTNFSNVGIAPDNINSTICNPSIPGNPSDGLQFGRALAGPWGQGEGLQQTVSGFVIGHEYNFAFDVAGCNSFGGTDNLQAKVFLDGIESFVSGVYHSNDTVWQTMYFSFNATNNTHTIGVRFCTSPTGPQTGGGSGAFDNFRFEESITTSITNSNSSSVKCFPNPFNEIISFTLDRTFDYQLEIYDITGKVIYDGAIKNPFILNTSEFEKGVYLYRLSSENKLILKQGQIIK